MKKQENIFTNAKKYVIMISEDENSEPVFVTSLVNQIKVDGVYYSAPHYTPSVFEDYFE